MKDALQRITTKENSSLLLQLVERVESAMATANQTSVSRLETSIVSIPTVKPQRVVLQIECNRDFYKMKKNVTVIEMGSGLCSDSQIQRWNLCIFSSLMELVVGDDCLQFVKELILVGFACLEKVVFGMRCFTNASGCLEISDCGALRSVEIGGGSCVNWGGFVMKDCGVEEVSIGDGCFVNCENVVFESERLIQV